MSIFSLSVFFVAMWMPANDRASAAPLHDCAERHRLQALVSWHRQAQGQLADDRSLRQYDLSFVVGRRP